MTNIHAQALGSIKSKKKSEASRENGKKGGRPKKPMEIKLTQGKAALVDREDYEELMKYKWHTSKQREAFYAQTNFPTDGKRKQIMIRMHRFIMKPMHGLQVDHIDGNGLNNTRKNLRICTNSQNSMNKGIKKTNTSGFKGVTWSKKGKKWRAQITVNSTVVDLGSFDTAEEAYKDYCEACVKYHGEFARLK